MLRDGANREQIESRMAAQLDDDTLRDKADVALVNIFDEELEQMVQELDFRFKNRL